MLHGAEGRLNVVLRLLEALLRWRLLAVVVVEAGDWLGNTVRSDLVHGAALPVLLVLALLQLAGDVDSLPLLESGCDVLTKPAESGDGQEGGIPVLPLVGLRVLAARVACDAEVCYRVSVVRVAEFRVCDEGCFGDGDLWKCQECSLAFLGMKKARVGISLRGACLAVCGRPGLF